MTLKIEAVLKQSSKGELKEGSPKYQNRITNVAFNESEGTGGGGFSSVASLFLNYIESVRE